MTFRALRCLRSEAGQSSVELLGLLPLIALVALCLAQLLATGAAHTAATSAAEAAATALIQHTGDPTTAARAAAPSWSRDRLSITVDGRHIRIRVRPRAFVPGTASLLTVTAEADAGPPPTAAAPGRHSPLFVARGVDRAAPRSVDPPADRAGRRSALAA